MKPNPDRVYSPNQVWVPTETPIEPQSASVNAVEPIAVQRHKPTHAAFRTSDNQLYVRNLRTGVISSAPHAKGKAARRAEKQARRLQRG